MNSPYSYTCDQAAVAEIKPETYVPWSKVKEICERIMSESDMLAADSQDYRIGQWSGAEKVMHAIDCYLANQPSPNATNGSQE
jgi:hypothetical protein